MFLNTKQVMKILGLSRRTLYSMRKRGDGPPVTMLDGRIIRYNEEDLAKWANENKSRHSAKHCL